MDNIEIDKYGYELVDGQQPTYSIEVDDPRGEFWLYSEGKIKVNIECGMVSSVFQISSVFVPAGALQVDEEFWKAKFSKIAARFLLYFGSESSGCKSLMLERYYRDNEKRWSMPELTEDVLKHIDQRLALLGFSRDAKSLPDSPTWHRSKTSVKAS